MSESVALCVIAGDGAIEEGFERMLDSVGDRVDSVAVIFTGQDCEVRRNLERLVTEFGEGRVVERPWFADFASARNESFELARRVSPDWLLWLDCDDILPADCDLQAAIAEMRDRRMHGAFALYNYQIDPRTGTVLGSHYKERIFRADVEWQWDFPIHECCHGPIATQIGELDPKLLRVDHLRGFFEDKRARNRAIVAHWFREEPENLRALMFMAHEVFAEAEAEQDPTRRTKLLTEALRLYNDFVKASEPDDDAYHCNKQMAEILTLLGRYENAIDIYLQGIKMQPTWPACYMGIAEAYLRGGDPEAAIEWARALRGACSRPKSLHVFQNLDLDYRPLMLEAAALRKLGRFDEALDCYSQAQAIYSDDFTLAHIAATTRERAEAKHLTDGRAMHRVRWDAAEAHLSPVAFFVPDHVEPWNPEILERQGLGGTETCVIKLAQALARLGRRVVVYGTPGEWDGQLQHIGAGVEWYRAGRFHPDRPFDAVISVRFPALFEAALNTPQKVLWLHDVNVGDQHLGSADRIICPSEWAAAHTEKVYGLSASVIHNGFEPERFRPGARDPNHMVYASSPDRGLERLLDLWPQIRAELPGAWLEVFYGWEAIEKIIAAGSPSAPMLAQFKVRIERKIARLGGAEGGIVWRGRQPHDVLARAFASASVMPYPATFMETFGIVFGQAIAAGCTPVASNVGALPELWAPYSVLVDGAPDSEDFGERFVEALTTATSLTQSHDPHEQLRSYSWESVAHAWDALLQDPTEPTPTIIMAAREAA